MVNVGLAVGRDVVTEKRRAVSRSRGLSATLRWSAEVGEHSGISPMVGQRPVAYFHQ